MTLNALRCLLITSLWASSASAAGLGVMASTGGSVNDQAVANVAEALERSSDQVRTHPLAAAEGDWWLAGLTLAECSGPSEIDLAATVLLARTQLSNLASAAALSGLDDAISAAPCGRELVQRDDLLGALELLAQAAQDEGETERARSALRRLVSSDSAYQLSSPPGSGYDDLWNEVRREVGQVEPVPVAVQHVGEVLLDGQAIPPEWTLTAPLLPGPHLLQWRTPSALAGGWITVPEGSAAGVLVERTAAPRLLAKGPADAGSRAALRTWLTDVAADAGLDGIAVVQDELGLKGYVVEEGRTGSWNALLTRGRSQPKRRQPPPPGVVLGLGLAAGSAGLGGLSAWQFTEHQALRAELAGNIPEFETRQLRETERDQALAGGLVFLGSAIAVGTASVVSLITAAVHERKVKKAKTSEERVDD